MWHNMHFFYHVDTENGPPLPPIQTMLGWRNAFGTGLSVQGCTNYNIAYYIVTFVAKFEKKKRIWKKKKTNILNKSERASY